MRSSDELDTEERQAASIICKKKRSSRKKVKFEDLQFKDTQSMGSVSDSFSEVLSDSIISSNADNLTKIVMRKKNERMTVSPKFSNFR